ncbi:MAG: adenylosuccinate lyase [Flavobacteriaceae bacterium]|nr:MAG: adenylosuccinate lyase [Flavobacteriaceae bacterium]
MTKDELYNSLSYIDHTRKKRGEMAKIILGNLTLIRPLMGIVFMVKDPVSLRACWALEYTIKNNLSPILPHLDYFTENLNKVQHESAIRPMAKICELLVLDFFKKSNSISKTFITDEHLERIATVCFDWLIGENNVAPKAYSMTCLLLIGSKYSWIHPELKMVLEQNYEQGSAAYKARARITLAKL